MFEKSVSDQLTVMTGKLSINTDIVQDFTFISQTEEYQNNRKNIGINKTRISCHRVFHRQKSSSVLLFYCLTPDR